MAHKPEFRQWLFCLSQVDMKVAPLNKNHYRGLKSVALQSQTSIVHAFFCIVSALSVFNFAICDGDKSVVCTNGVFLAVNSLTEIEMDRNNVTLTERRRYHAVNFPWQLILLFCLLKSTKGTTQTNLIRETHEAFVVEMIFPALRRASPQMHGDSSIINQTR